MRKCYRCHVERDSHEFASDSHRRCIRCDSITVSIRESLKDAVKKTKDERTVLYTKHALAVADKMRYVDNGGWNAIVDNRSKNPNGASDCVEFVNREIREGRFIDPTMIFCDGFAVSTLLSSEDIVRVCESNLKIATGDLYTKTQNELRICWASGSSPHLMETKKCLIHGPKKGVDGTSSVCVTCQSGFNLSLGWQSNECTGCFRKKRLLPIGPFCRSCKKFFHMPDDWKRKTCPVCVEKRSQLNTTKISPDRLNDTVISHSTSTHSMLSIKC